MSHILLSVPQNWQVCFENTPKRVSWTLEPKEQQQIHVMCVTSRSQDAVLQMFFLQQHQEAEGTWSFSSMIILILILQQLERRTELLST